MSPTIESAILTALQNGKKEPYVLPRWALPQVRHALDEALASGEAEHEVRRVLALSVALETEMKSPSAAALLLEVLADAPLARQIIADDVLKTGAIDETRRFRAQEGRDEGLTAPRVDERGPPMMKLAQLVDPISKAPLQTKARSRSDSGTRR